MSSDAQIAEELGVPPAAVGPLLYRARQALAQRLRPRTWTIAQIGFALRNGVERWTRYVSLEARHGHAPPGA